MIKYGVLERFLKVDVVIIINVTGSRNHDSWHTSLIVHPNQIKVIAG